MKKFLLMFLKVVGIILLLGLVAFLSYLGAQKMKWPVWASAIIFAGFLGFVLLILFLRRYFLRKRERKFIERIIARDRATIEGAPEIKRLKLLELQEHWKESIEKLQQSHLRKLGNPLYVLPWFLVLGESRNGKTSAIKNGRVASALTEVSRAAGIAGTRNCDWWFCEEAIILDTAGRYAIPVEEGPDLEEWKEFLRLLAKYRKKEPLNGVIVVVSADNLLSRDKETLKEIGQSIRLRIDQMMRTMGAKFPVYVMVTKMDLVHGFTHFAELLPDETLSQAMGYTNQKFNISWKEVLDECQNTVGKRLRDLRFLLVNKHKQIPPGSIMFPLEFERLFPRLGAYLEGLFEENPYQEVPLFRGIYFSSAMIKGSPISEFLELTHLKRDYKNQAVSDKGIFLKDFFQNILPKDRHLFSPLLEFLRWKKVVNNLALMTYLLFVLCLGGVLTLSFYKNFDTITSFKNSIGKLPELTKDRIANLFMLDKMRQEIEEVEEKNKNWFVPRLGLDQSLEMELRLKKHFSLLFEKGFLNPIDAHFVSVVERINRDVPVDEFVDYIGYAVIRASVLRDVLQGKTDALEQDFVTFTKAVFNVNDEDRELRKVPKKFAAIYYSYLKWNKDRIDFYEKLREYEQLILKLLKKKGNDLFWLVDDIIANAPAVHLNAFWRVEFIGGARDIIFVPGAYTKKGRENIKRFISLLEESLTDRKILEEFKKSVNNFWKWYEIEFFDAWYSFIENFNKATDRINNLISWQKLASQMATSYNPYLLFIERFHDELSSLGNIKGIAPLWVKEFEHIYKVIMEARTLRAKQKGSLIETLKVKEEKIAENIEKKIDKKVAEEELKLIEQARAWNDYMDALRKVDFGSFSIEDDYRLYAGCFEAISGFSQSDNSLIEAYERYYKFRNMMDYNFEYATIYDLPFGPLGFLLDFALKGASCYLQQQWEEKVLSVVNDVDPDRLTDVLFNKNQGVVWKYVNEVASPFLGKNSMGYFIRRDFRKRSIPFKKEFLTFLNKGAIVSLNKKSKYHVVIKTVPMSVNSGAEVEPLYTSLTINCASGAVTLDNYNFPNKISIDWSPETCGDVVLSIKFPDVVLKKKYSGKLGFARFLKDFSSGTRVFYPDDFPENKDYLKHRKISWIELSYLFEGEHLDVASILTTIPKNIPQTIVECPFQ
ncbi:MAG: type VI secretion protein IcmF/TssM N-terminal domain-containing protein [Desulfonauticus sp.]|nr:type VI secretion protein IcmF/TssM N-terminal domain-containing protein [Desulfonauticus sp.]